MHSHDHNRDRNDYKQPSAADPAIDPKRRYLCRHVFTDGHRCGSPSLRGQDLCYYHVRSRREAPCAVRGGTFVMSRIDDRPSVQLALYDVLSRVAAGDIEYRRGSVLLYGLQIASSNLARHQKALADQPPQVEEITFDYHLGDLAPITEIPDSNPQNAPTDQPIPQQAPLPEQAQVPEKAEAPQHALVAEQATVPKTDTAAQPATEKPASEIGRDFSPGITATKPIRALAPETPFSPNSAQNPLPADVATITPSLHIPLPTHDATGRPYPPSHKLDPPSNGIVPKLLNLEPRTSSPAPLPRYTTYTHDSYPRMAP